MGDRGNYDSPNPRSLATNPPSRDYVQEYQQTGGHGSYEDYLVLIGNDIERTKQELRRLESDQRWFEVMRQRQGGEAASGGSGKGDYGDLRSQDTYADMTSGLYVKVSPLRSDDYRHDDASTQVIQDTDTYGVGAENPYNPKGAGQGDGEDPYGVGSIPGGQRGLQCKVVKDFEAHEPHEIDLIENDWVELLKVEGNRYYGSVFGRGGKNEGWFHKRFVEVIPDSRVGSLVFRHVAEGTVKYSSGRDGLFSVDVGKKFDVLQEDVTLDNDRINRYHRVRDVTGKMGLVITFCLRRCESQDPVLYQREWYYPRTSRKEAEKLLENKTSNTFLLRDSTNAPGNFTISVGGEAGKVYHVIVITHKAGYRVRNNDFKSLDDVLAHYRVNVITRNLTLQHPLAKEEPPSYQNMTNDVK